MLHSHYVAIITKSVKLKMGEVRSASSSLQNYLVPHHSAADRSDCFAIYLNACSDRYYDSANVFSSGLFYRKLCRTLYKFDSCCLSE